MDRGAWRATVHGVTKSLTQLKQLSTAHTPHIHKVTFVSDEVPWRGAGSGSGALADVSESMNLGIHALPRREKGSAGLRACPSWAGAAPCWPGSLPRALGGFPLRTVLPPRTKSSLGFQEPLINSNPGG